ncbi:uracil-DNA glycosylase [Rhodospirillum centenum]|uniref:Type-5 uracil-DNA glycosylase n=1 Tax=Rhodospirillum centenum (strain ATCC 51521 / SW) TaxID=414684 RepID=B6IN10_RHOCS|nr:uracil-DNA glycosylase [Rhodospirillum centenum]ACI98907.1 uracil-DNA glycosylase superfamily [Rhodospirillum centenum SW]
MVPTPTGVRLQPDADCPLCPRLAAFRQDNRARFPDHANAPVPSFGPASARLLIVGLAPGLHGANRTGRPFTGDYAGDLLYETLALFGFARGRYDRRPDDGLELVDCRIVNSARCVPPENKPTPAEVATCRRFLIDELEHLPDLRAVVALGTVAHASTVTALGGRASRFPFAHGARHEVRPGVALFDSYHCSRYNTNTGRLTPEMFHTVFKAVRDLLDAA